MRKIPFSARIACVALAASLAAISTASNAGFLDDFYSNSGNYQGNLTKPGVIQSNTLNTVTGGSFVYKAPRRSFSPFYASPPSLKAGCGGVDLLLGSWSLPSQQEFLAFLRNIGQALPGLAFELALQSMSPELAQQVAAYKDMLMKLSQNSIDACQAASSLLSMTGADMKIKETVHEAENYGRSVGLFSDQAAATKEVATNGKKAIDTVPVKRNPAGEIIDGPEVNVVWAMLNNNQMAVAMPQELKELMMSLVGTWIYRRSGVNDDQVLSPEPYEPKIDSFVDYIGTIGDAQLDVTKAKVYRCDEPKDCLNLSLVGYPDTSFANRVYTTAMLYRDAIISRDPLKIDWDQFHLLSTSSSIPLLRIVGATAYSRFGGYAGNVIAVYSEAVAYDLLLNYIDQLTVDTERAIKTAQGNTSSQFVVRHAEQIRDRLKVVREAVRGESDRMYAKINATAAFVTQIEHIERSLKSNLAADLAANMAFSGRR